MEDELIKKGAEVLSKPAQELMEKVGGSPLTELGELFADKIRVRRYRAALRLSEKAQEIAQERGVDPKEVPLRTLLPILDHGANEEDDEMADRWARLLASAASGPEDIPPAFASILAELSPTDARMLDTVYNAAAATLKQDPTSSWEVVNMKRAELAAMLNLSLEAFDISTSNLLRLQLLLPALMRLEFIEDNEQGFMVDGHDKLRISVLGRRFVEACGDA